MEKTLEAFLKESIASREKQVQVAKDLHNPISQASFEGELRALKIVLESLPEFTSQPSEHKPPTSDSAGHNPVYSLMPIKVHADQIIDSGRFSYTEINGDKLYYRHDVISAMNEFAQSETLKARNSAIEECIEKVRFHWGNNIIEELSKLKK